MICKCFDDNNVVVAVVDDDDNNSANSSQINKVQPRRSAYG